MPRGDQTVNLTSLYTGRIHAWYIVVPPTTVRTI